MVWCVRCGAVCAVVSAVLNWTLRSSSFSLSAPWARLVLLCKVQLGCIINIIIKSIKEMADFDIEAYLESQIEVRMVHVAIGHGGNVSWCTTGEGRQESRGRAAGHVWVSLYI